LLHFCDTSSHVVIRDIHLVAVVQRLGKTFIESEKGDLEVGEMGGVFFQPGLAVFTVLCGAVAFDLGGGQVEL
jgi:hypothetical protein